MKTFTKNLRHKMVRENRVYIMPSGSGAVFFLSIVVLVLAAATYNNNLIFILAFFLSALFVVTMLQTNFNLKSVRLQFLSVDDAFEGDKLTLLFQVYQKRFGFKRSLRLRTSSKQWATVEEGREELTPREPTKPVRLTVKAWKRGVHPLPTIILETYYPLGLFRAWKVFRPQGEMIVYPQPAGRRVLEPSNHDFGEEELGLCTSPEGDFGELKPYQPGESYHQIAWKHYARTGNLYSKVHWGEEHKFYRIPWDPRGATTEIYLRQMSQWVKLAMEENASFEMELPHRKIEAGNGTDQAKTCWRELALLKGAA
ncbi:MAG: hypothetical protein ACXVA9_09455 [Bdellovibrionales bacterium]